MSGKIKDSWTSESWFINNFGSISSVSQIEANITKVAEMEGHTNHCHYSLHFYLGHQVNKPLKQIYKLIQYFCITGPK